MNTIKMMEDKKTVKVMDVKGLNNNIYKEFADRKLCVNLDEVEDKLSMLVSTTKLGSEIGITITRGSNILMLNKNQIFDREGNMTELGLSLLAEMLVPLKKLMKKENIESVKELKGGKVETIYDKNNRVVMTNRFGMTRELSRVSEAEIQACINQIKSFNMNTTVEEYDIFVEDFVYIVRGLGESSIDVKKHEDRHYSLDINGFVGSGSACKGNMKAGTDPKKSLTSNLYLRAANVLRSGWGYQMFLPEELDNAFEDAIGDIKIEVKDELEDCVNDKLKVVHGFNYDNYLKRLSNLHDLYPVTRKAIKYVSSLVRGKNFTQLDEEAVCDKFTDKFLAILRNCIFGVAKIEGMQMKDVYSLAIEVCFLDNKGFYHKDNDSRCVEINKMLSAVDKIFGDISVFEYADNELNVPLTVTDKPDDFADGNVYFLEDGATEDFDLCVEESFTGMATVVDGKLVASYDPYSQVDDSYVAIPIDNFFPIMPDEKKEGRLAKNKKGAISALRHSDITRVKVSDGVSKIYVPVEVDGRAKAKTVGYSETTIFDGLKLKTIDLLCFEKEDYIDLARYLYIAKIR